MALRGRQLAARLLLLLLRGRGGVAFVLRRKLCFGSLGAGDRMYDLLDARVVAAAGNARTSGGAVVIFERTTVVTMCPATRRPYHTLLTGQGTVYNGWQARIMYHHWKKQANLGGRCTEMTLPT